MALIGYARVSTADQKLSLQLDALNTAGCDRIFDDHASGAKADRPGLTEALAYLRPGDTLVVKSIDRLGRNYAEILEQWRVITKQRQAAVVVLDMPLLDTRRDNDLTGTLIADIVLQLLSYVAQVEREFIRQRQAEGIAAAKRNGVRFGREAMQRPEGYEDCLRDWQAGRISARQAAAALGVCHKTFLRWTKLLD